MSNDFIKKFKMSKIIEKAQSEFRKGEKFNLFSSVYEICTDPDTNDLILRDEMNNKISLPRAKLRMLINNGMAEKHGNLAKTLPYPGEGIHNPAGSAKPAAAPKKLGTKAPPMASGTRDLPVGTIHNGRQKVSDHPSKWVDLHSGHSYADHKTAEKNSTKTPDNKRIVNDFMAKIASKLHPKDLRGVTEKLHKFIEAKTLAHNMTQVANHEGGTGEQSFASASKIAFKKKDEAAKARAEFVQAVRESQTRKKTNVI